MNTIIIKEPTARTILDWIEIQLYNINRSFGTLLDYVFFNRLESITAKCFFFNLNRLHFFIDLKKMNTIIIKEPTARTILDWIEIQLYNINRSFGTLLDYVFSMYYNPLPQNDFFLI